jgi:signal transduction histidine kinase
VRLLAGRSIAVRLAAFAAFWSLLILLIAGIILAALYRDTSERAFDQRLLVYANDLVAGLIAPSDGDQPRELGMMGDPRFQIPLSGWYWQVGRPDAPPRDMRSSRSLLGNQLPRLGGSEGSRRFGQIRKDYAVGPERRRLRLIERDIDLGEDGRYVVRVAGPADEVSEEVGRFIVAMTVTFGLLGLALGLTTLLQIRFGLAPLLKLRAGVAAIRRGDAERIAGDYPRDVAPLADELNLLIESNREILDRARTQVGNLAHALKTPLSIIVNEADASAASDRLRQQTEVMRHQIDYYLNKARAAGLAGRLGVVTDANEVIEALARTFAKIFRDKGLKISLALPAAARFRGERQDFEEMVGNLIDNACKWCAAEVDIAVEIRAEEDRTMLDILVDDDGPGMPAEMRARMPERGRRLDETKPGSGLGLSIVAELATHYRGVLTLVESPLGGLRARLQVLGEGQGRPEPRPVEAAERVPS